MWERKNLKETARFKFFKNYWLYVVVSFILLVLAFQNTVTFSYNYNYELNNEQNINTYDELKLDYRINDVVDGLANSSGFVTKFIISTVHFILNHPRFGILLIFSGLLEFLYYIFLANPLSVGGKKFYLSNTKEKEGKIKDVWYAFKDGNYWKIVKKMFFYMLFLSLWLFTIIGYFIKFYEYRMIPYLLADNPNIDRKELFLRSKEMMRGNKFKAFVLDLSFILWNILGVLTFGLANIFFVNPYKDATNAELYLTLKG